MYVTIFQKPITSKRSLVYHSWITLSATLLGFAIGTLFGILIAIGITNNKALDRSLMPWVIAANHSDFGHCTNDYCSTKRHWAFWAVTKGAYFNLPKFLPNRCWYGQRFSLTKKYPARFNANLFCLPHADIFQTSLAFSFAYLFPSMKIAIAIALVGAIVGELPTGAVAGLGARLLSGSYYGQTVQIWSALFMAAILAASLVMIVGLIEKRVTKNMGLTT